MKKKYGSSWEKYSIKPGEIWKEEKTDSYILVSDIRNDIPDIFKQVDMIYCDPPWSKGNANFFITKAELNSYIKDFSEFYGKLFDRIKQIDCFSCYLEIGRQNKDLFLRELSKIYPCVDYWNVTYYKKNPCFLLRGGHEYCNYDYSGLDEEYTPAIAINEENSQRILDLCIGRGLVGIAAFREGKTFLGIDINKRKLAVLIERITKLGGRFKKYNI